MNLKKLYENRLGRLVIGSVGGMGIMLVLSPLFGLLGDSCAILCKPEIAGVVGAFAGGLLVFDNPNA